MLQDEGDDKLLLQNRDLIKVYSQSKSTVRLAARPSMVTTKELDGQALNTGLAAQEMFKEGT